MPVVLKNEEEFVADRLALKEASECGDLRGECHPRVSYVVRESCGTRRGTQGHWCLRGGSWRGTVKSGPAEFDEFSLGI